MNHEAFARLVAEDVKQRVTTEQAQYIRDVNNLSRWQNCLIALLENLSNQLVDLDNREAEESERYRALGSEGLGLLAEMQSDIEQRRKRIYRFRYHVEQKLDEAARLIASSDPDPDAEMLEFLRQAIEMHKSLTKQADIDATAIDEALWGTLHGRWDFDDIDPTQVAAEL